MSIRINLTLEESEMFLPLHIIFSLDLLLSGQSWKEYQVTELDRVKRIWYLSPMRAAKVQASLRIRAVSPEPSLLAHTNSESRGTFRQKARYLATLNGWACAVKVCHDGMLEDTNSLDGAQIISMFRNLKFSTASDLQISLLEIS